MRSVSPINNPSYKDIFGLQSDLVDSTFDHEPESILITGAQGMLGNGVAQALNFLQRNGILTGTRVLLSSREWSKQAIIKWKKNSSFRLVLNSDISQIQMPVEVVIHAASPSNMTRVSTFGDLNHANVGLLMRIQDLNPKRIVYISSGEVYGSGKTQEETHSADFVMSNRRDWYPLAKLEAELELEHFVLRSNSSVCVLRLFHTFGPGVKSDDGRSFADILWGAAKNNEIRLYSQGEQVRSFLYLSDAVEAILRVALTTESGYRVANLGSTKAVSIREFAEQVRDITGSIIRYETNNNFVHSPNDYLVPIIQNISLYGWAPKLEIGVGIERTISWIKNSSVL